MSSTNALSTPDRSRYTDRTMTMPEPVRVEPRDNYRIYVEYDDGERGEVDLSDVAGQGTFKAWDDRAFFEQVHLTEDGAIGWPDDLDICPDRVYFDLTGKIPEEMMPGLRTQAGIPDRLGGKA